MQRVRYLLTLECANCGAKGAAEYADNKTLPRHEVRLNRSIVSVRGAFLIGSGPDPKICAHCQTNVA